MAIDLTVFRASENAMLSTSLMGIERQLEAAAQANLSQITGEWTERERNAMVIVEELRLINGLDLAAILLRGKLLQKIEEQALWSDHPNRYPTLQAMAQDQGIPVSSLSQIRDLCFVIFPWIESTLRIPVAQMWEQVGKSNFLDLLPVLKCMITGEPSDRPAVNASVSRILDDVAATARSSGNELTTEELRRTAVGVLLSDAGSMTNRDLRQRIRPEHTNSLEPIIIDNNGEIYVIAKMDEDQLLMLTRRLHGYMDPVRVSTHDFANSAMYRDFTNWR